jgi:hypothetical protein
MSTRESIAAYLAPSIGFAAVVLSADFDMSAISAEGARRTAKEHVQHDKTDTHNEPDMHDKTDMQSKSKDTFYDDPAPNSFASGSSASEIDDLPHNDGDPDEKATRGAILNRGDPRLAFLPPAYVPPKKSKYLHNFCTGEEFTGTSEDEATVEFSRMRFSCLMTRSGR